MFCFIPLAAAFCFKLFRDGLSYVRAACIASIVWVFLIPETQLKTSTVFRLQKLDDVDNFRTIIGEGFFFSTATHYKSTHQHKIASNRELRETKKRPKRLARQISFDRIGGPRSAMLMAKLHHWWSFRFHRLSLGELKRSLTHSTIIAIN